MKLASAPCIDSIAHLPAAGTLAFLPRGDLLVMERRWETTLDATAKERRVRIQQFASGGWEPSVERSLERLSGSPLGCAVSPDGAAVAAGHRAVKLVGWPDGKVIASLKGVKYQLERASVGFSPSGACLAVGDGGYINPPNRWLRVYSAIDGRELAKVRIDEFCLTQVVMVSDETVLVRGLRHDYEYASTTEPQRVLACYDLGTSDCRWRRRYWSAAHGFVVDTARAQVWAPGEHVIMSKDFTRGLERGLECLSLRDGTTVAAVELAEDIYPRGVLAFLHGHAIAALSQSDGPSQVFAVNVSTGAVTRLGGATPAYAASDPETGRVALSISKTETGIYTLPG